MPIDPERRANETRPRPTPRDIPNILGHAAHTAVTPDPEVVKRASWWRPPRRKVIKTAVIGTVAGGIAAAGIEAALNWEQIATWIGRGQIRVEFSDVWDQLQAFLKPPTDEEIQAKVYNPDGALKLTPDNLKNLLIVSNGDSMNLANGIRHNSLGTDQPDSWLKKYIKNLEQTADLLGMEHHITGLNYAQPGAAGGLVRDQFPMGNVQLGAENSGQMQDYPPNTTPPVKTMIDHDGDVVAEVAVNGDHLKEAFSVFMNYFNTNTEFKNFCENPSEKVLLKSKPIQIALRTILETYQKNIKELHDDFKQATNRYRYVNEQRIAKKKKPIRIICALPINYRYANKVPVQVEGQDADRHSGSSVDLDLIPSARNAALRVTSSYYETLNPLLADFSRESGIEVVTVPLLQLSQNQNLFSEVDGHFNPAGEEAFGDLVTAKTEFFDPSSRRRGGLQPLP